jgi:hypothetical protein
MGLFGMKISLSLSLLDRSCIGGFTARPSIQQQLRQTQIQQSFSLFVFFSSLSAMMIKFVLVINKVLSPNILSTNSFILAYFLLTWQVLRQKCTPPS